MGSPKVFQRIIEWGDGWIPIVQTSDELAAGVKQLHEFAKDAGRDPNSLSVSVFGLQGQWRTRDEVASLEAAGAERVIIWLQDVPLDEILKELEDLAAELLT
jgi:alkanesulfonate monooxygenase SsuD/methylene tetrahydromethanopterin reductase-like flavin-dependent oxidoreductase (luciferase family)